MYILFNSKEFKVLNNTIFFAVKSVEIYTFSYIENNLRHKSKIISALYDEYNEFSAI